MTLDNLPRSPSVTRLLPISSLILPLAVAGIAATYVWWYYARAVPEAWSDFDQVWIGARALLAGREPYSEVRSTFPWPLYYPLPALLLGLPFATVPLPWARVLFAAVTAGLSVWAVLRFRPHLWPMLCSVPFVYAIQRGQWVPLLVVAALVPSVTTGTVLAVKPNIGLAMLAYRPSLAALVGALALGLVSLAILPAWPWTWLAEVRSAPHIRAPILLPGGILLALAFARWRDPGARLLGVLALTPQTRALYELLPLALLPRTRRVALAVSLMFNMLALLIMTHWGAAALKVHPGGAGNPAALDMSWFPMLLLGYLPGLGLVLAVPPSPNRPIVRLAWRAALGLVGVLALLLAWYVWRYRGLFAA